MRSGARRPKATKATKAVLAAFLDQPGDELHGFALLSETGLRSGTLYPLLIRLENVGWLESRWEEDDAPGPRRRLYRLTGNGEAAATEMLTRPRVRRAEHPTSRLDPETVLR
jgi:PadR family transcriptional regulator, regulatory protein PadR